MKIVAAERDSPSDSMLVIVDVCVASGSKVSSGAVLFEFEGAKSVFEQTAPSTGYVYHNVVAGDEVKVGGVIAVISEEELSDADIDHALLSTLDDPDVTPQESNSSLDMTSRAKALWEQMGKPTFPAEWAKKTLITTTDVESLLREMKNESLQLTEEQNRFFSSFREQNLDKAVLVGGNRGAIQVLDALESQHDAEIVGFIQDFGPTELENLGFENLGQITHSTLNSLRQSGVGVVYLAIGGPFERIDEIIGICAELEMRMPPIIHKSVSLSKTAIIEQGVRIMAGSSVGAFAKVESGAFISAHSNLEHHSRYGRGSHCGPGLLLSGGVVVEEGVRIGTNVAIEPGITIGSRATLASGTTITRDIPPGTVVKKKR